MIFMAIILYSFYLDSTNKCNWGKNKGIIFFNFQFKNHFKDNIKYF